MSELGPNYWDGQREANGFSCFADWQQWVLMLLLLIVLSMIGILYLERKVLLCLF